MKATNHRTALGRLVEYLDAYGEYTTDVALAIQLLRGSIDAAEPKEMLGRTQAIEESLAAPPPTSYVPEPATPKQCSVLKKNGYRTDLTKQQAALVIHALVENEWAPLPPAQVPNLFAKSN